MIKRLSVFLLVFLMPLWASAKVVFFEDIKADVQKDLAEGEPRFTDQHLEDFIILSVQASAAHGLACRFVRSRICGTDTADFWYADARNSDDQLKVQGLFLQDMRKDEDARSHQSLWEIGIKDSERKTLIDIPPMEYYYLWHDSTKSYFHLDGLQSATDTLWYTFYFVPVSFETIGTDSSYVPVGAAYRDVIVDHTLFLCYSRIKAWTMAWEALERWRTGLSAIRQLDINRQVEVTIGPQIIP